LWVSRGQKLHELIDFLNANLSIEVSPAVANVFSIYFALSVVISFLSSFYHSFKVFLVDWMLEWRHLTAGQTLVARGDPATSLSVRLYFEFRIWFLQQIFRAS
jgi:hypothetical protein